MSNQTDPYDEYVELNFEDLRGEQTQDVSQDLEFIDRFNIQQYRTMKLLFDDGNFAPEFVGAWKVTPTDVKIVLNGRNFEKWEIELVEAWQKIETLAKKSKKLLKNEEVDREIEYAQKRVKFIYLKVINNLPLYE